MKKNILFLTLLLLATSGCSKTWSGIKQDSVDVLDGTREVIHEATAPSYPVSEARTVDTSLTPLPNMSAPVDAEMIKDETIVTPLQ